MTSPGRESTDPSTLCFPDSFQFPGDVGYDDGTTSRSVAVSMLQLNHSTAQENNSRSFHARGDRSRVAATFGKAISVKPVANNFITLSVRH